MPQEGKEFEQIIHSIITRIVPADVDQWLTEKARLIREEKNAANLNMAFAAVPRKTGRQPVELTEEEKNELAAKELSLENRTIDRLARLWILLQIDPADKSSYFNKIETLFKAAEMNELAALYASLPFLAYPGEWQKQCAEGIRNNIGIVQDAIMYNNPYPSKYLDDKAWNQLVLKAFFADKDINKIIGLDERANKELAIVLVDYANERRAAHRAVNPQLWRLVSKFIDATNFDDISKAFKSNDINEKKGAALACFYSNYEPAKKLLNDEPLLKSEIEENKLNWTIL